jgi:hypothetical protein
MKAMRDNQMTSFGVEHEPGHPVRSSMMGVSPEEDELGEWVDGLSGPDADMTFFRGRYAPRAPWEVLP